MPIPKPYENERESEYIGRCTEFLVNEGTDQEQAVAICYSEWNDSKKQFKPKAMKYSLKQILDDKKNALKEHKDNTKNKNKSGYHVATKQSVNDGLVKAAGNVFWFFDYDADVLTPDSVTETLKNRDIAIYHLKNHQFNTDGLIGSMQKVYVDEIETEEFGNVEALLFESEISDFEWYAKGVINQHSIGFRYDDIELAVREDAGSKEEQLYKQYVDRVINKEEVNDIGYFYLVRKITLYEISAVLRGANRLTSSLKVKDCESEKAAYEILNKLKFT